MGSTGRTRYIPHALAAAALLFSACATVAPPGAPAGNSPSGDTAAPTLVAGAPAREHGRSPASEQLRFLLVYVIHGDADYIYHDAAGRRRLADEDALDQAREVAKNALAAEVFIFHQKPRWHLWRHPTPDGMFYHYRRGELRKRGSYSREGLGPDFEAEARLFRRLASPALLPRLACPAASLPGSADTAEAAEAARQALIPEPVRFFVYFGHEIPQVGGLGYSRSHPRAEFTLAGFARGLERFAGPPCAAAPPYSLVVLSACRGGTPATTRALFPYTDWLLAAPTELHLSFLDTRAFISLLGAAGSDAAWSREPRRLRVQVGAERMLRESFGRLQARTQTPVSLSLYESRPASAYLEARPGAVEAPAVLSSGVRFAPMAWRDCGEMPAFGAGGDTAGVKVLYRPGRFGLLKSKQGHSGWECPSDPVAAEWLGESQEAPTGVPATPPGAAGTSEPPG